MVEESAETLCRALGEWARSVAEPERSALAMEIKRQWEGGRRAWPELQVPQVAFAEFTGARSKGSLQELQQLPAEDLYLACACSRGEPRAIAYFEERFAPEIGMVLARLQVPRELDGEICQTLRYELFVDQRRGKRGIDGYAGRGPLGGWLRVVLTRIGLRIINHAQEMCCESDLGGRLGPAAGDPELSLIKQEHRALCCRALQTAVDALPRRQRLQIKLYYQEGLSMEQIATLLQVHQSTVTRNLQRARQQISSEMHQLVAEELDIPVAEVESLVGALYSQLELSLRSVLGDQVKGDSCGMSIATADVGRGDR